MIYLISFIFWTIFGSFISVLIWRIKNNEKWILLWRSKCPKCWNILNVQDLVPIFSYIFLKWKCRYCKNKISIIYPVLELTTWIVFAFLSYLILWNSSVENFINNWQYVIYWWIIAVFFVALAFYDILFYEISFILAAILGFLLIIPQFFWIIGNWQLALMLAISWFIIFLLISYVRLKVRKIEWMWGWDAIWAAILWLLTPILIDILWINSPAWLTFYVLLMEWFFLWALFWVLWLTNKKLNFLSKLPFLPFMFWAVILFVFTWKFVLNWIYNL